MRLLYKNKINNIFNKIFNNKTTFKIKQLLINNTQTILKINKKISFKGDAVVNLKSQMKYTFT